MKGVKFPYWMIYSWCLRAGKLYHFDFYLLWRRLPDEMGRLIYIKEGKQWKNKQQGVKQRLGDYYDT